MQPRPHDNLCISTDCTQPIEMLEHGLGIGIEPAADQEDRTLCERLVKRREIEIRLFPVSVKIAAFPLVEKIVLIGRHMAHWRRTPGPLTAKDPVCDLFSLQRGGDSRIGGLLAKTRMLVGPGDLLHLECATAPDATLIAVPETTGIQKHRLQALRA